MSLGTGAEGEASQRSAAAPQRSWERYLPMISTLGIIFLAFQAGILVAVTKSPPYPWFSGAYDALQSCLEQRKLLTQKWPDYLWYPTERKERGLARHDVAKAQPGYTLYTSGHEATAILVDMEGKEVYRWTAPFSKVWPPGRQGTRSIPDRFVYMRRGRVFPNGDLLALYETPSDTPNGRGLARLDKHSNVIWTYDEHCHHDLFILPRGDLWVLCHRLQPIRAIGRPVIEDLIVHLDKSGKELERISILELLIKSKMVRTELDFDDRAGDITHTNTVHVLSKEFADHYPSISPGDLMVCLRNLNLVLVINPQRREIVWGTTGPWYFPHDPEPLANGNFIIFDNYCQWRAENTSAVIEFDPRTRSTVWSFRDEPGYRLRSDVRSGQQVLANGNLLINESGGGRMVEVTRAGEVVWEYINPVRGGEDGRLIPILCSGVRYSESQLPFLKQADAPAKAARDGKHQEPSKGQYLTSDF